MALEVLINNVKPVLAPLLLPPVPFIVLALLGWMLARAGRRWLGIAAFIVALTGLWLGGTKVMSDTLLTCVLKPPGALTAGRIDALAQNQKTGLKTAVLVLGGGIDMDVAEYQAPDLKPYTLARLRYGIWLARHLQAPLGFTGGLGLEPRPGDVSEASVAQRVAVQEFGQQLSWAEDRSRTTHENALFSMPMLRQAGVQRLVLVTNAAHMRRALRDFQSQQIPGAEMELVAAPIDNVSEASYRYGDWWPGDYGLRRMRYVVYEWLAWQFDR